MGRETSKAKRWGAVEVGDGVRVEERRFGEPRFKDVDGQIGRVVDLREREGGREALVRMHNVFVKDGCDRILVGCRRHHESSVNLDSFLAD